MSITYKKTVAVLDDICTIEEAETLYEWLLNNPKGQVNLKTVSHIHSALVQVLMYAQPKVTVFPESENMRWLKKVVKNKP